MNNSIRVPEDKDFVCAFVASEESIVEAMECYRRCADQIEVIEMHHVLTFILCALMEAGNTEVSINEEVLICIEHLINEKNIIRKNNADKKA